MSDLCQSGGDGGRLSIRFHLQVVFLFLLQLHLHNIYLSSPLSAFNNIACLLTTTCKMVTGTDKRSMEVYLSRQFRARFRCRKEFMLLGPTGLAVYDSFSENLTALSCFYERFSAPKLLANSATKQSPNDLPLCCNL